MNPARDGGRRRSDETGNIRRVTAGWLTLANGFFRERAAKTGPR